METKNQSVIVSGESGAGKVSRGIGMEVFKIIGIQLFTSFIIFRRHGQHENLCIS